MAKKIEKTYQVITIGSIWVAPEVKVMDLDAFYRKVLIHGDFKDGTFCVDAEDFEYLQPVTGDVKPVVQEVAQSPIKTMQQSSDKGEFFKKMYGG